MALAIKEVQQLRRNPGLIIQLMIPPTIVLVIFGFALNPRVRDLRLGVVDQNLTVESRNFIDALTQNINFNVTRVYSSTGEAESALKNLDLDLFLAIPHDFDRMLERGQTASIQVVIDAVDANTAQIAQGYLQRAMEEYNTSGGAVPVADFRPASNDRPFDAPCPAAGSRRSSVRLCLQPRPGNLVALRYGRHEYHHVHQCVPGRLGPGRERERNRHDRTVTDDAGADGRNVARQDDTRVRADDGGHVHRARHWRTGVRSAAQGSHCGCLQSQAGAPRWQELESA